MTAKVLMVDVDGVLIRHPHPEGWAATLEQDLGLSKQSLQQAFFKPHVREVMDGRAGLRERLAPVLAQIAPHLTCNQLIAYWFDHDAHIDRDLLAELARVRSLGLKVHLATVQEHERARYLWETLALREHCDDMHYAASLGCSKPSPAFYEAVEARSGFDPAEILFIDDKPDNVAAAKERGWTAALWRPDDRLADHFPELDRP